MSDTASALGLFLAVLPAAAQPPKVNLADVSGEVRVAAPMESPEAPPRVAMDSQVWVVSGYARLETDLPATIWLAEGDRVRLSRTAGAAGRYGLSVAALPPGGGRVDLADAVILLEPGEALSLAPAGEGRVAVTGLSGTAALSGAGWTDELAPGERLVLRAAPPMTEGESLDMAAVTTQRLEGERTVSWTVRAPQETLAEAAERPAFVAEETDLRSAVAMKAAGPPRAELASGRSQPAPLRGPVGRIDTSWGAVEPDRIVAALAVAVMLFAGWWWARRVA